MINQAGAPADDAADTNSARRNPPPTDDETRAEDAAQARVLPQLAMMVRALWASPTRSKLIALAAALFVVVTATAYGQIRLNSWNQPFYDALSRRNVHDFTLQLGVFAIIASVLLILNVTQKWIGEMTKLTARQGLVLDLIHEWMLPRRAFRLASAGPIGTNPDQRMHEDARHLTELSTDLGIGLLQSSILLVIFVHVLWAISGAFAFTIGGRSIEIPGYMVWAAVFYAASASLMSYWVGRSLVSRNEERYAREADLRYSLVRVNEQVDAISLASGEADETRRLERDLTGVLRAMRRLVTGLTNLTWVTAGYGWITLVAPILAATPLYFSGRITFGGLMMAAGAFTQLQSSLRWFVDNFSVIADWRATLLRVASFRRALIMTDGMHRMEKDIAFGEGEPGKIVVDHLEISSPSGCTMLEETHVEIKAGERVLIVGEPGTGKTALFRALAGLWPWGAGRVTQPKGESVLYLPRVPYLPQGTLREVLSYPAKIDKFTDRAYVNALARLKLKRLTAMLDESKRWERELSEEEIQRVAFARVLLQAPAWVLIDEMLDALDDDTFARVAEIFGEDLKSTGLVHIGRAETRRPFYSRVLHLVNDPTVRRLARLHMRDHALPKRKAARSVIS